MNAEFLIEYPKAFIQAAVGWAWKARAVSSLTSLKRWKRVQRDWIWILPLICNCDKSGGARDKSNDRVYRENKSRRGREEKRRRKKIEERVDDRVFWETGWPGRTEQSRYIVGVNSGVIVRVANRFASLSQREGTRGFYSALFPLFSRSGFMCMTFYRRDGHVIEVQTGSAVSRPEEACSPPHFQQHNIPFLTLVSKYNRRYSSLIPFIRFGPSSN